MLKSHVRGCVWLDLSYIYDTDHEVWQYTQQISSELMIRTQILRVQNNSSQDLNILIFTGGAEIYCKCFKIIYYRRIPQKQGVI